MVSFAALALGLLCLIAGLVCVIVPLGVHFGFRAPRVPKHRTPADCGLRYESVRIPTRRRRWLAAWLLPAAASITGSRWRHCTIVMLHGWGSNAEQILPIALPLVRAGYNLLLLDARNHGASDGDTFSSLPRFAEDLEHSLDWLQRHRPHLAGQLAVLGHSVGAGAVLLAATRHPAIDAAISIAAFAHPREVTARFLSALPQAVVGLVARYVEWLIGYRFDTIAPLNTVRLVRCPLLLVHGTADRTVPLSDAQRIYANRAGEQIRLIAIPEADHASTDRIEQHADRLLDFLAGSLPPDEAMRERDQANAKSAPDASDCVGSPGYSGVNS